MRRYGYSQELKARIRKEYVAGALTRDLAEKYGISVFTMHKTILRGLPKHSKQRPLIQFDVAKDRDYYEVLGLIAGDGHVRKYVVGFSSVDRDLAEFVCGWFKKYSANTHIVERTRASKNINGNRVRHTRTENIVICNSVLMASIFRDDLMTVECLKREALHGFVDGLMSAEGGVSKAVVHFAQNEPKFTTYMTLMRKVMGEETNITTNQNGCRQAHWSPYESKRKRIFSHCERKLERLRNCQSKSSKRIIKRDARRKVIAALSGGRERSLNQIRLSRRVTSGGTLWKLLEKMCDEGIIQKRRLGIGAFGKNLARYSICGVKRNAD